MTYDVTIDGRGYNVDTQRMQDYWSRTVPLLRQQSDASSQPSEASLNPEGAWLRGWDSFHRGAGQSSDDGVDAMDGRFYESLNVDPWTKGELRQGHGLDEAATPDTAATSSMLLFGAGNLLYQYAVTASGARWNIVDRSTHVATLLSSGDKFSGFTTSLMATDGDSVWALFDDKLVRSYYGGTAVTTYTQDSPALLTGIEYTNGRLIGWGNTNVYDLSGISNGVGGTLPAALTTLGGSSPIMGIADGRGYSYLLRNNGTIYKFQVQPDGTSLGALSIAGTLPAGEVGWSIFGYLGFIMVGTSRGARLATSDSSGNLTFGAAITDFGGITSNFVAVGSFIFAAVAAPAPSTGAWSGAIRFDLSTINETQPAYAGDFAFPVTATGGAGVGTAYGSIAVIPTNNDHIVCLAAQPDYIVFSQSDVEPTASWLDTGKITWGLSDPKEVVGVSAVVSEGTLTVAAVNNVNATANADNVLTPTVSRSALEITGQSVYLRLYLDDDAVVDQVTLRAFPAVPTTDMVSIPLLIWDDEHVAYGDTHRGLNPPAELAALYALRDAGGFVTLTELGQTRQVQVVGVDWFPDRRAEPPRQYWNGTVVVTMKTGGI